MESKISNKTSRITSIEGRAMPLPGDDIDTDRIIPARYMKTVTFKGLGNYTFYDARYDAQGKHTQHPFNDKKYKGATILIVGKNFGCGSSREHAPQALKDFGIKALIGSSFAEIFAGNCTTLGMPLVTLPEDALQNLMRFVQEEPDAGIIIDLKEKKIRYGDFEADCSQPESMNKALTHGLWDSTGLLLANDKKIDAVANRLPYLHNFVK